MSVCLLLATCDSYAACGFSSLSVSVYPCVSLSADSYCWKLTGFQLTKKILYCIQPELSLLYTGSFKKI